MANKVIIQGNGNSVEIEPIGNSVEIISVGNQVEILPHANSVEVSVFDVYTHRYFLSSSQILEEHEEVK